MEKIKTSRILLALAAVSLAVAISHIASSLVAALYIIGIVGASLYLSYLFKSDNYDSIFAVPTYGIFDATDLVVPSVTTTAKTDNADDADTKDAAKAVDDDKTFVTVMTSNSVVAKDDKAVKADSAPATKADSAAPTKADSAAPGKAECPAAPSPSTVAWIGSRLEGWLRAKGFVEHDISIKDVAAASRLKVDDIRCWLTATDNGMFSQWLSRLRTDHAKLLLRNNPAWSIDMVADKCGFTHRQSLARAFKKETGQSPTEWAGAGE